MPETVSLIEFARLKGVAPATVTLAIQSGRLNACLVRERGSKKTRIIPDVGLAEWDRNTNHNMSAVSRRRESEMTGITDDPPTAGGVPHINRSKAILAAVQARRERLELDEYEGRLVDAKEVEAQAFKEARGYRDKLLGLPDRLAGELIGITDIAIMHARIVKEVDALIDEIANVADV